MREGKATNRFKKWKLCTNFHLFNSRLHTLPTYLLLDLLAHVTLCSTQTFEDCTRDPKKSKHTNQHSIAAAILSLDPSLLNLDGYTCYIRICPVHPSETFGLRMSALTLYILNNGSGRVKSIVVARPDLTAGEGDGLGSFMLSQGMSSDAK